MATFADSRVTVRSPDSAVVAGTRPARAREALGLLVLFGGIIALAMVGHAHYPIQHWLFWRFASYWLIGAVWVLACVSGGSAALQALDIELPGRERLLFSFATGVLVFVWGMFLAGLAGMFRPVVAVVWPLVLLLLGGRQTWASARELLRSYGARPIGWAERAATAFGLLGLAMIYVTIITPSNVGFDAQWYHLPIAEHYAAAGAIVPFEEGWFLGTYPHLASIVYAWGFLLPGTTPFDRVLIAAHLEFAFFLATLASIPLMVGRLLPGASMRATWAALFLFPGVLLYDGGLFVAADHVLAFWAIPIYLGLVEAARAPTIRRCLPLTIVLAGALLTKYQALYLLVPVTATFVYALARGARGHGVRRGLATSTAVLLVGLVLTVPHWLPNWWWYGDPFYPYLRHHLSTHPFTPSAMRNLESALEDGLWRPTGTAYSKFCETARALWTFSFEPHDWATYHGSVPVFGSLFTITSLLVPILKGSRHLVHVVVCTLAGVAAWYMTFHQDRYLQALLPWMVCTTVAIAHMTWTQLPLLRPLLVALGALQIVWGGDVYFIPANDDSHELNRPSPVVAAVELMSSGFRGEYTKRLHPYEPWETIGASLPPRAKILLHERYVHLGLGAMSVSDLRGYQGGISYEDAPTPAAIYAMLSRFGVTHVLWETAASHGTGTMAEDLAFFRFATQWTADRQSTGKLTVARLESRPPPTSTSGLVAWYDCGKEKGSLRSLRDLDDGIEIERIPILGDGKSPPDDADFVVIDRGCPVAWSTAPFEHMADRGPYELWTRRRAAQAHARTVTEE